MGELVDFAGWIAPHWPLFYTVHDLHRALFLAPIIYASYFFRIKGALSATATAFVVFLPRALLLSPFPDAVLRMAIFTLAAGVIGVLVGIISNQIELRVRLEDHVRDEKNRLLSILEKMSDAVMIVGPDYRIRFMNASMAQLFGQGVGACCYNYLLDTSEPCKQICKLSTVIGGAAERWEYNCRDGRTMEAVATPYIDTSGEVCQLTTLRDITQRKGFERELIRASELKSELLSNVSHELKSPLTSIKGIVSSLAHKDIEFDADTREMLLSSVMEETDRLTSLVTNLLDMSKLEAGVWKPEKEPCDILDIINEAIERQKWIHQKHLFKVISKGKLPEINADYSQIRQVLINLLENAAAYSPQGTRILVRTECTDGGVRVSVSDEGTGIPRQDLAKIFDKFYRSAQKTQRTWGVGLGLSICQAIVNSHGGRIWAESSSRRGSTFCFNLPVAPGVPEIGKQSK